MSITPSDLLSLTYSSLRGNFMRSALTSLGVFMGVTAVSATLQARDISKAMITKQLAEREAPQVQIYPDWNPEGEAATLQLEDIEFLRKRLGGVRAISGNPWMYSSQTVLFGQREAKADRLAVSQEFLETSGRHLLQGRFLTETDFTNYRPVVVIDQFLVDALFREQNPLNQRIYVDNRPYFVVGVIESKNAGWGEPTGLVLMTLALDSALTGNRTLNTITIRPDETENLESLGEQATQLLQQRHSGKTFWASSNIEDLKQQQQLINLASQALLALGGVSLVVGGVGIANITIASVRERTSEIGLRRAVGATQSEIMLQFLTEATVLSLVGGTMAILVVQVIITIIVISLGLPYQLNPITPAIALSSAFVVGVGAGFFPAWQASKLEPVQALRSH